METELKLRFASPEARTGFLDDSWAQGLILPGSISVTDMLSLYFDTDDLSLTSMKTTLRVRQEGDERIVTVKTGGRSKNGLHQRLEWSARIGSGEWPATDEDNSDIGWFLKSAVSDGDPDDVLWDILQQLEGRQLRQICQARFRRTAFDVGYGDTLMELCLDDGELSAGSLTEPVNELELELKEGDVRDLMALGEELTARFPLTPENKSKFARCLALLERDMPDHA